jgi:mannose/fructose/N-acetylgalactosamine-specific phosphotransferase system component IID
VIAGEPSTEARRRFLVRHLESFNTNPALAGPLLGALARLEEQGVQGDARAAARAQRLKGALEGPFAAQGDALLWAGSRPAAALLGGLLTWGVGIGWGPVFFLLAYNSVHLGFRVGGVFWGYRQGEAVHRLLRSPRLRWGIRAAQAATWSASLLLGAAVLSGSETGPGLLLVLGAGVGLVLGRRGFARGTLLAWGAMIAGLILALGFGIQPR